MVDKGVSMLVMDRDDYNSKAEDLLHQQTYRLIPSDPTNKLKNRLITLLKKIKTEGGLSEATYKRLYPTGARSLKFYGLPKVHKQGTPLRPIVSSIGQLPTRQLRSYQESSNPWWEDQSITYITTKTSYKI